MISNEPTHTATVQTLDTGIDQAMIGRLADALCRAVADTFSLYLKTLGTHWNIVGPNFYGIHKLTEQQYEDLDEAIDALAERIRGLGYPVPAGFAEFRQFSIIEVESTIKSSEEMLRALIADNEALAKRFREFSNAAQDAQDKFTEDMLIGRIGAHEKNAWMLKSLLS
ncbi:Dps family protein [Pedomonas mirosovicensis]|uniref:Dps family protein n=1 Tax=Pedomonas mirosovicensis TaxID=2908641 RepID=UPI002167535A|nr:DNA starvation/stationary phase protection protein [Pedomonas mirosovicensis]MCH8685841.1 DNA starvation/stationary phase protection protein [Pedomonas mirosovicensis]